MAQRSWAGAAVPTAITAGISGASVTFSVADATGWPTGGATAFIAVLDRGEASEEKIVVASRSGVVFTVSARGHDGTSAVAHDLGAAIEHCIDAESVTRFDRHVEDVSRDDHTQYQKESEKGAASGYASLDGSGTVPVGQLPAALALDSDVTAAIAALSTLLCPPGTYRVSAEGSPGTGWLLCNGQTVSRTTYAALFAVMSTTYNTGGEAGTDFRLPDGRGRTLIGAGTGTGLTARTLGQQTIGAETHTLAATESGIAAHTHTQNSHNHTQDSHLHTLNNHNHSETGSVSNIFVQSGSDQAASLGGSQPTGSSSGTMVAAIATNQAATATNQNAGPTAAASAHNNMQPSIVVNLFVKT